MPKGLISKEFTSLIWTEWDWGLKGPLFKAFESWIAFC